MLLFNVDEQLTKTPDGKFKNILCYCSTHVTRNTVNVIILFKNILCYCSTEAITGKSVPATPI